MRKSNRFTPFLCIAFVSLGTVLHAQKSIYQNEGGFADELLIKEPSYEGGEHALYARASIDKKVFFGSPREVNIPPTIDAQNALSTLEDEPKEILVTDLTITDPDNIFPGDFTLVFGACTNCSVVGATLVPTPDFSGTMSVKMQVSDGTDLSNEFLLNVTVTSVDDKPTISGNVPLSTAESQPLLLTLGNFTVSDVDNPPSDFVLVVQSGSNYTFSGNTITPSINFVGPLVVNVVVSDGTTNSDQYGTTVNVTAVNDAPKITGQKPFLTTTEEQPYTITFANLDVLDDDPYPTGFTLTVQGGANYTVAGQMITPALNFNGTLNIDLSVNDGALESNVFPFQLPVTAVNDAPVISGQNVVNAMEDQPFTISVSHVLITDPDNVPADFTITVLSGTGYTFVGNLVTTPLDFSGPLTVNVSVSDGALSTPSYALSVTVAAVNDAPVITAQKAVSTNEDTPKLIQLTDLVVTDPDNVYPTGFTLTVLPGTNYTVSATTITPAANFFGQLTVPIHVNDGTSDSKDFDLLVSVTAVNDSPIITSQLPIEIDEDQPRVIAFGDLLVSDPDNNYPTGFTLSVMAGASYTVSGNTIIPVLNFSGNLSVNVFVNDGLANSNTFPLVVKVNPVNDPPVITAQQVLSVNEDTPITLQFSNLTVVDADNTYPTGFTLAIAAGANYTAGGNVITPNANFNGLLTVSVTVNDGTTTSVPFNVKITVTPVNDSPVITGQTPISIAESKPVVIALNNLFVSDPDNNYPTDFSLSILSGSNYSVTGTTVTPITNFSGILNVKLFVNDGAANSAVYNFQISVNSTNDPPMITGQKALTINEDQPLTVQLTDLTVSDPDNSYPADFTLTVLAGTNYTATGSKVTPAVNFNGTLSVKVSVNDGTVSSAPFDLQVTVTPVNDAPVITGQSTLTTNEEQAITIKLSDVTVTDPDNTYPTGFTMTVLAGVNYTFSGLTITPAVNFNGKLSVPVVVNDGALNSANFLLQIQVNPVNDAPLITGQKPLTTAEGAPLLLSLANFTVTDIDNSYPTGFTLIVSSGTNYTVSGTTITPVNNFSGDLSVAVRVNDGADNSPVFNAVVKVNGVNEAPTSKGFTPVSVDEDNTAIIAVDLTKVFNDREDGAAGLTYALISNDKPGYFETTGISQSTLSFKLNANAFGVAKITVRATDSGGLTVQDILTISINGVNDPPSFNALADIEIFENAPQQSVTISNISSGPLESQALSITVSSGNTALIPQPIVTYNGTGPTGTLTFKPSPNATGSALITVRVTDTGLSEFTQTFTVSVVNINDAPTLNPITVAALAEDSDVVSIPLAGISAGPQENQVLTIIATASNSDLLEPLTVVYTSPQTTGSIKVKPKANAYGSVTITVRVTDDGSNVAPNVNFIVRTFTLTVTSVNDAPIINSTPVLTAVTGEVYSYALTATDVDDAEVLTITATQKPAWLSLTGQGNGKVLLSGTPPANAGGPTIIKLQVKDKGGLIDTQEYTLVVDSRPVVSVVSLSLKEDEIFSFSTATFSPAFQDADNDAIDRVKITALPKHGGLALGSTAISIDTEVLATDISNLRYTPNTNFNGKDTLYWNGSDGTVYAKVAARVLVTITPVNDAPEVVALEQTVLEIKAGEGAVFVSALVEAIDIDNDSLTSAELRFRTENFITTKDILTFTNTTNITGNYNAATGTLTFAGKAPKTEYTEALRSVKYDNISEVFTLEEVLKTISYTVNDGTLLSITKDREIKLIDKIEEIDIPTGFTPNNDTDNDTWVIDGLARYPDARVRVFTMHGQLVYENTSEYTAWDGSVNGNVLPPTSYFYTIDLNLINRKKTYRGSLTILH